MNKSHFKIYTIIILSFLSVSLVIIPTNTLAASKIASAAESNEIMPFDFDYSSAGTFQRLGGSDRYETAVKISQAGWTDNSSEFAVLAAGMDDNLVDSLTAAPLAKLRNAPILLTEGDKLNAVTETELKRLGVKTVYIVSGTGIITQPVRDKLQQMNITMIPLGGRDRFETSLNICKQLGDFNELIVSTAWSNADALSVASIAASNKIPILLSDVNQMPQSIADYVASVQDKITKTYVLGGEGVISKGVERALPNPVRLGGLDRFNTNVQIILAFSSRLKGEKLFVAGGNDKNLVDALAGSALAGQTASAIVLVGGKEATDKSTINFVKHDLFPVSRQNFIALGGESVVSSNTMEQMSAVEEYSQDGVTSGLEWTMRSVTDNIVVNGNNISLNNLDVFHNILITGNNINLNRVNVSGAIIINPGDTGKVNLSNLTANYIIIASGDPDAGVVMNNVEAKLLMVLDKNDIGVNINGSTDIESTFARGNAYLSAASGSFGQLIVAKLSAADGTPNIKINGEFDHPILVSEGVIESLSQTTLPDVMIAPDSSDKETILKGNYNWVNVATPAKVQIADGALINRLTYSRQADITISDSAVVKEKQSN